MTTDKRGVRAPRTAVAGSSVLFALILAGSAGPAAAAVPDSLHDPGSCKLLQPTARHAAFKCDDGIPSAGGTSANATGAKAITVPAKYGGDGYTGLPGKAADAAEMPGADDSGDIALDVDVTLPARAAPKQGLPLLFFMHGCCSGSKASWEAESFDTGGERWHYSNVWFAARGYAVVNYTARGFVNGQNQGSTGETQLGSRSYEINDYQHLACQVAGSARRFEDATGKRVRIDPRRVVTTGGSYGGGFSWMALTDPRWRCGEGTGFEGKRMRLAVTAPKYGWTDLLYSLVPTGAHSALPGSLPATDGCQSGPLTPEGDPCADPALPVGVPKRSIVAGLYASGRTGAPSAPPNNAHTTFPASIDTASTCLQSSYPPESNPLCASTLSTTLPEFLRERSAYYQQDFFRRVAERERYRVPVFSAGTFTDQLFTSAEHRRMANRLLSIDPDYPIQAYHGDFQHFTQNKAKEWGDVCAVGGERRVCTNADHDRGFNRPPSTMVRKGVTTRLNDFVDRYARPFANRRQRRPRFDVTASLQVCPENSAAAGADFAGQAADEPGPSFHARRFERLAPNTLALDLAGAQTTTSDAEPNPHGVDADPVGNLAANGGRCPVHSDPAGPGVATYTSEPLDGRRTMIGSTAIGVAFQPSSSSTLILAARLYDVYPDGRAVLVDRGLRRLSAAEAATGRIDFELHGAAWRFPSGHRVRIELAQDDEPFLAAATAPSSMSLSGVAIWIPVREG